MRAPGAASVEMIRVRHVFGVLALALVGGVWAMGLPHWITAFVAVCGFGLFFWVPLARGETYKVTRLLVLPLIAAIVALVVAMLAPPR
jgi:K+-sensing histidine kinase KdpD